MTRALTHWPERARWRTGLVLGAVVGLLVLLVAPLGASATTAPSPQISVSPSAASAGATVQVSGSDFPAKRLYQVQVCGNDAALGSTDCDQSSAVTVATTSLGELSTPLPVVIPPMPCPCVVAVQSYTGGLFLTTPLAIPGAPTEPAIVRPASSGKIVLRTVELQGNPSPKEWLGFSASRTLVLTVQNVGSLPIPTTTLIANIGSTPIELPSLPGLAAGQTRTYRLPVSFPALSVGKTVLSGQIGVLGGQFATFKVPISFYPWAIPLVAIVVGQGLLLAIRNLLRRRIRRREAAVRAAALAPTAAAAADDQADESLEGEAPAAAPTSSGAGSAGSTTREEVLTGRGSPPPS